MAEKKELRALVGRLRAQGINWKDVQPTGLSREAEDAVCAVLKGVVAALEEDRFAHAYPAPGQRYIEVPVELPANAVADREYSSLGRNGYALTQGVVLRVSRWFHAVFSADKVQPAVVRLVPVTSRGADQRCEVEMSPAAFFQLAVQYLLAAGCSPDNLYEAVRHSLPDFGLDEAWYDAALAEVDAHPEASPVFDAWHNQIVQAANDVVARRRAESESNDAQ